MKLPDRLDKWYTPIKIFKLKDDGIKVKVKIKWWGWAILFVKVLYRSLFK